MAEQPIEIPIKLGGINQLKKELKDLKDQIAQTADPIQKAFLADKAGDLEKKIKGVNSQIKEFAKGNNIDQVRESFDSFAESLINLDFEKAGKKAVNFSQSLTNLKVSDLTGQIKGFTSVIKTLGTTFLKLGLQLLTNPLFYLAIVVAGVVAGVYKLLDSLGLIKPIFDAIGKAIGFVVQMFKDLTDWLGLTDNEGEEYAKNEIKRLEKLKEKNKEYSELKVDAYEREIKILKASGKDTTDVERAKQKEILRTAQYQFDRLNEQMNNRRILSKMSAEELTELRKSYKDAKRTLLDAKADLTAFNEQIKTDQREADKKESEARLKAQKEANDKILQARKELRKKLKQDIIDNENETIEIYKNKQKEQDDLRKKQREDLDNAIIEANIYTNNLNKSQEEIELQAINDKYRRQLDLAEQFNEDTKALEEAKRNEINAVLVKSEEERIAREDAQKVREKEELDRKIANEKALRDAKIMVAEEVVNGLNALGTIFIKDQKKLEKFQKATALFQIAVDTAKAISSLIATSQANPFNAVTFGGAGIAQYAAGLVQILTNIAKAKQILSNAGNSGSSASAGGSSAGSSTPSQPRGTTSAVPQVNLFGQGNQFNSASNQGNAQGMVVKAVVSETEISAKQNQISKFEQFSVL